MMIHTPPFNHLRRSLRLKVSLLAALLALSACGYKAPSIGQEDILIIVVSDLDRPLLQPLLMNIFDREMATPSGEPYFKVKIVPPEDFEKYRNYGSLVVASLIHPADSTGDVLARGVLGEERTSAAESGENPIFITYDLFAKGQIFMGIMAADAIHAHTELERLGGWIFDQFETQLRRRQSDIVYRNGDNAELADSMLTEFGWTLRLEPDYLRIKVRPAEQFVWLGRGYPYRWLLVHWVEGGDLVKIDREWAWLRMEHIADSLHRDIFIDSLFRSEQLGVENGHTIFMLKGVWGHKQQTAGGPFITYIFRDREQNRIYFTSGMIFHPSGSKGLLIKRQEVMMRTFHTFALPPPESAGGANNLTGTAGNQRQLAVAVGREQ